MPTSRWCSTCARRCRARRRSSSSRSSALRRGPSEPAAAHRRDGQSLFGIVQGGTDASLRSASARRTVELDFDGYAIGGLSVGETRAEMLEALDATVAHLPPDRPRYLMGVGDPASLVESVARGIDQFDCVMQTRLGRHGTALTGDGKLQVKAARHGDEDSPIDERCPCAVCARHSRGYLRHLFAVGEPTALRLVSLHNVAWTLDADGTDEGRDQHWDVRRSTCRPAGRLGVTHR